MVQVRVRLGRLPPGVGEDHAELDAGLAERQRGRGAVLAAGHRDDAQDGAVTDQIGDVDCGHDSGPPPAARRGHGEVVAPAGPEQIGVILRRILDYRRSRSPGGKSWRSIHVIVPSTNVSSARMGYSPPSAHAVTSATEKQQADTASSG